MIKRQSNGKKSRDVNPSQGTSQKRHPHGQHVKRYSFSSVIREMEINTTMSYHNTSTKQLKLRLLITRGRKVTEGGGEPDLLYIAGGSINRQNDFGKLFSIVYQGLRCAYLLIQQL